MAIGARARNKILAVLAGGIVLGVGATVTLASWNDSEYAFGGNGSSGPGVGTSTFDVQQDATSPWVSPGTFADFPTPTSPNRMTFTVSATAMSPGGSPTLRSR